MTPYLSRLSAPARTGVLRPRARSRFEPPPVLPVDGLGVTVTPPLPGTGPGLDPVAAAPGGEPRPVHSDRAPSRAVHPDPAAPRAVPPDRAAPRAVPPDRGAPAVTQPDAAGTPSATRWPQAGAAGRPGAPPHRAVEIAVDVRPARDVVVTAATAPAPTAGTPRAEPPPLAPPAPAPRHAVESAVPPADTTTRRASAPDAFRHASQTVTGRGDLAPGPGADGPVAPRRLTAATAQAAMVTPPRAAPSPVREPAPIPMPPHTHRAASAPGSAAPGAAPDIAAPGPATGRAGALRPVASRTGRASSAAAPPRTELTVTIGRIEVTAPPPAPSGRPPARGPRRAPQSLEQYLQDRAKGRA